MHAHVVITLPGGRVQSEEKCRRKVSKKVYADARAPWGEENATAKAIAISSEPKRMRGRGPTPRSSVDGI